MYGATAWTLTNTLESKLDGIYTRMLMRAALNPGDNIPLNNNFTGLFLGLFLL